MKIVESPSMPHEAVRSYYNDFAEREWARLEDPADGAIEFAITCHALATHLPSRGRVLDLGGGPGRYALWLAEHGHRVVLADLSPTLLQIARTKVAESAVGGSVEQIVEADACDLSRWPDGAFDAVLALGPFYHLPEPNDREQAAAELIRVLRPGGVAFVALMPRYAFLRRTIAVSDERRHLADSGFVEHVLAKGTFANDIPGRFTGGYGVRPEEVSPFFERHGFTTRILLACEGIIPDLQGALAEMRHEDPVAFQQALDLILQTASDPSILGMSAHLLYVASKEA
jgi:S-adenosylmethionine-dependent methyltransferase